MGDIKFRTDEFARGEVIFEENTRGNTAFIIKTGEVEIYKTVDGKETILTRLSKGALLGEMALIEDRERSASARAIVDSELVVITKEWLAGELEKYPAIIQTLVKSLIERLRQTNEKIADLVYVIEKAAGRKIKDNF